MSDAFNKTASIVTAQTPRGPVDVTIAERKGLHARSDWHQVFLARRSRTQDWRDGTSLREAIRKALLVPAGKPPIWLASVVGEIEQKLAASDADELPRGDQVG